MASKIKANRKLILIGTIIILVITILFIVLIYMAYNSHQTNLITIEEEKVKKYKQEYQTILYNFKQLSDNYYYEIVDDKNILNILYEAKNASKADHESLRNQLKAYSLDINKKALDDSLDGLRFLLEDNTSFLDLSRQHLFEDETTQENVQYQMMERNTPNGTIYQYPLKYKGENIGYVEFSVSHSTITKLMSLLYNIESAFIIEKQAISDIPDENQVDSIHVSVPFSNKYLLRKDSFSRPEDFARSYENVFEELIPNDFNWGNVDLLSLKNSFFITISYEYTDYSVVFLFIDNITNDNAGYFIFVDEDTYYYTLRSSAVSQYIALVLIWILIISIIVILLFSRNKIEEISYFDNLTHAYNRNKLFDMMESEICKDKKNNSDLCILLIDVDNFKNVNDMYGHLVGDTVLKRITDLLFQLVRSTDMVFRYGGDEFIILLPNTTLDDAEHVANKINKAVSAEIWDDMDTPVTLSIGVAKYKQNEDIDQLINRSDNMLYKAKELGRNRVVCDL